MGRRPPPVVGYLVADNGTGGSVHDEPDVGFDAANFDVGFIRDEHISLLVGVAIHKRLDADSGSLAVVGNLLVGDGDVARVFQCLRGFAQEEFEVDIEGQAQGHGMRVMLTEFQGGLFLERV